MVMPMWIGIYSNLCWIVCNWMGDVGQAHSSGCAQSGVVQN
jgi:hypothetical protein